MVGGVSYDSAAQIMVLFTKLIIGVVDLILIGQEQVSAVGPGFSFKLCDRVWHVTEDICVVISWNLKNSRSDISTHPLRYKV